MWPRSPIESVSEDGSVCLWDADCISASTGGRWGLAYLESRLNLEVSLLVAARLMLTVGLWLGFNLPLPTLPLKASQISPPAWLFVPVVLAEYTNAFYDLLIQTDGGCRQKCQHSKSFPYETPS